MTYEIDLSPEAIASIKALAQKATPGPWIKENPPEGDFDDDATFITTEMRQEKSRVELAKLEFTVPYDEPDGFNVEQRANADFISGLHPGVVLAMCEEIERLRAEVGRLEKEADWLALKASNKSCPSYLWAQSRDCCGSVGIPPDCVACWRDAARKAVEEVCSK